MKSTNIHTNHRSRMKKKFLENGGDNYYPHQLLEMLLFYTIPRIDTNPVAHRLLKRFANLESVLNAGIEELKEVEGIGPASACFICAAGEICRRYSRNYEEQIRFSSVTDLKNYFTGNFTDLSSDSLVILSVSSQLELMRTERLSLNDLTDIPSISRLIASIILKGDSDRIAAGIIHICAPPVPTQRDYHLTRVIAEAASAIGAELIDMVICSGKYAFSMKETGAFSFS